MKRKLFVREDDIKIKDLYETRKPTMQEKKALAMSLGRSVHAIETRASKLNLSTVAWTLEEDNIVYEYYEEHKHASKNELKIDNLAKLLGRTSAATSARAIKLKLTNSNIRFCAKDSNRFIIDEETGCWNWQKYKTKDGYGREGGKEAYINYYVKMYGKIPKGLELNHLCKNKSCVNPEHLEAVTHEENMRRGKHIVLSLDIARQIRQLASQGKTYTNLAHKFNYSISGVSLIVRNKLWKEAIEGELVNG